MQRLVSEPALGLSARAARAASSIPLQDASRYCSTHKCLKQSSNTNVADDTVSRVNCFPNAMQTARRSDAVLRRSQETSNLVRFGNQPKRSSTAEAATFDMDVSMRQRMFGVPTIQVRSARTQV